MKYNFKKGCISVHITAQTMLFTGTSQLYLLKELAQKIPQVRGGQGMGTQPTASHVNKDCWHNCMHSFLIIRAAFMHNHMAVTQTRPQKA